VRATAIAKPLNWSVGLDSMIVLPTLLQDIVDKADRWGDDGKNGRIDPFTDIYDVKLSASYVSI